MRFTETRVQGAWVLEPEPIVDERGFFGRLWCAREIQAHGLNSTIRQTNIGFSQRRGTLRGLHLQRAPHAEVKLVRCTRGAVFDVVVDLRPDSPTFCHWHGVELTPDNRRALYVPEGCATGYLTLTDVAEIYYHTSAFYAPDTASGVRFDDPAFGIDWPAPVTVISPADRSWPDFSTGASAGQGD
jgi:dTDP-4-dehydrorhamnose 3,5-epimerase